METDADGLFWFTDLKPGSYSVAETVPEGSEASTPISSGPHDLVSGDVLLLGYVFGNYTPVDIHGVKYDDLNGNGAHDDGEPGLPGVTVTLTGTDGMGDPVEDSMETDADGLFWFTDLAPGSYSVAETVPEGSEASTPISSGPHDLVSGDVLQLGYVFGNYTPVDIHGVKYDDLNGNGAHDDGEPGLPGVTVTLTGTDGMGDPVEDSMETDADGLFWFTDLAPGSYSVAETVPEGSEASTPISSGPHDLVSGDVLLLGYVFGNYTPVDIHGVKYDDLNGNGAHDDGEPGLPGVTVTLTGTDGMGDPVEDSMETDADGLFWFTDLKPGSYSVAETVPEGSEASTPISSGPHDLVSGDVLQLGYVFGNYTPVDIHGVKYDDLNGNGAHDDGEPGLPGVTVTLTGTDGMGDPVEDSMETDADGLFWFTDLKPGSYSVAETVPEGSEASTPISSGPHDLVSGDVLLLGYVFGNYTPVDIHGVKYDDLNGNGAHDDGEPGLPGVTVTLTGIDGMGDPVEDSMETDADGLFWFTDLAPGSYSVAETVPDDMTATTPISSGPHDLESGDDLQLGYVFGNFELFDIAGVKFNDKTGDGVSDDDMPLEGVMITLYRESNDEEGLQTDGDEVVGMFITGGDGAYSFTDLGPGDYYVAENVPDGWMQTAPADDIHSLSGASGEDLVDLHFANFERFDLSGTKFNDINGDGITDDDTTLAEVAIHLYRESNGEPGLQTDGDTLVDSTLTDENGDYSFSDVGPGDYYVTEDVPDGWTQTWPVAGIYAISGMSGADQGDLDFANTEQMLITGRKFLDENVNGRTMSRTMKVNPVHARTERRTAPTQRRHDPESVKDTTESIIVAFVLAFVFRTFIIEAFVIPTGSMASTLYGKHGTLVCEDCGWENAYGLTDLTTRPPVFGPESQVRCQNCAHLNSDISIHDGKGTLRRKSNAESGDRILVFKWPLDIAGWFLPPRRWDVTVFKNPARPDENFIKRLLGVPEEVLEVIDGDVYSVPIAELTAETISALEDLRSIKFKHRTGEPVTRRERARFAGHPPGAVLDELADKLRIAPKTEEAQRSLWHPCTITSSRPSTTKTQATDRGLERSRDPVRSRGWLPDLGPELREGHPQVCRAPPPLLASGRGPHRLWQPQELLEEVVDREARVVAHAPPRRPRVSVVEIARPHPRPGAHAAEEPDDTERFEAVGVLEGPHRVGLPGPRRG